MKLAEEEREKIKQKVMKLRAEYDKLMKNASPPDSVSLLVENIKSAQEAYVKAREELASTRTELDAACQEYGYAVFEDNDTTSWMNMVTKITIQCQHEKEKKVEEELEMRQNLSELETRHKLQEEKTRGMISAKDDEIQRMKREFSSNLKSEKEKNQSVVQDLMDLKAQEALSRQEVVELQAKLVIMQQVINDFGNLRKRKQGKQSNEADISIMPMTPNEKANPNSHFRHASKHLASKAEEDDLVLLQATLLDASESQASHREQPELEIQINSGKFDEGLVHTENAESEIVFSKTQLTQKRIDEKVRCSLYRTSSYRPSSICLATFTFFHIETRNASSQTNF